VVKVIWHKTTLPLQMDGSIIFTRWPQCALPCGRIGATWWIRLNLCFLWPTRVHNPNCKLIGSAVFTRLTAECHRVHLRHLVNTIELILSSAHPSPQPYSKFSHFCTAYGRKSLCFTMGVTPKIGLLMGVLDPFNSWFLVPFWASNPNGITISRAVFTQVTAVSLYFTVGAPFPLTGTPSNVGFHGPIRVHNENGITISWAVFALMTSKCPYISQWDAPFPVKIASSHGGSWPPSNTRFPGPTQVLNPNGILISGAVFAGLTSATYRLKDHTSRSVTINCIYIRSTGNPV